MSGTKFRDPDQLWKYSLEAVTLLRNCQLREAADILESATRYTTSSGWEWLGELGHAAETVLARYPPPPEVRRALKVIARTARSRTPYAQPETPRSVRHAAACLLGFAVLLILESIWVGLASRWSQSAREWAGTDATRHAAQLVAGACIWSWVAWSLLRGRRWAWLLARTWAIAMGGVGAVALLGIAVLGSIAPSEPVVAAILGHPVELAAGALSVILLIGCAVQLRTSEAKEYSDHRKPDQSAPPLT